MDFVITGFSQSLVHFFAGGTGINLTPPPLSIMRYVMKILHPISKINSGSELLCLDF